MPTGERVFLVVIDDSEEVRVALRYACLRAAHSGGRVALLYVIEPPGTQDWLAVADLYRAERRAEAEERLERLSGEVQALSARTPVLHIREGRPADELLALIGEDPSISILVLGAAPSADGPGPLVSLMVGRQSGRLRVPVTVVPGTLSDADLERLT